MNLGSILIIFSLVISFISLYFLTRSAGGNDFARITSQRLFYLSGISITFAVILLFTAFLSNSFQFTYVFNYSSSDLSVFYLFSGFWAGQEGTFLLWAFLLFVLGLIVIRSEKEYGSIILFVITITQIFILITLTIPDYSPFRYVWDSYPDHFKAGAIPENGSGLNPLLQNPWMIIHPPVLFVGYASATIPFAYAIAGLLKKDFTSWINRSYRWVLFCMSTLGVGIFLGAYWAYTVLGWGGYWGWDPVENSSLIPWLVIIALMHGLLLQKRKGVLVKTNILLALVSFILVFYSTFLTRSGVLSDFSVHSFSDLGLSGPLIFYILFFIVISAYLFLRRIGTIQSARIDDKILSADNLINFGIIALCIYAFFILIGTSMPILSKAFLSKPTTVKQAYYNNLSIPFGIIMLLLIILSILRMRKISTISLVVLSLLSLIFGVLFNVFHTNNFFAYIFAVLSLFMLFQSILDLVQARTAAVVSSRVAHIGVAFLVIGIIASNLHSSSVQKRVTQNEETKLGSVSLIFEGITQSQKSSLQYTLRDGDTKMAIETPYYFDRKTNSLFREPYIRYGFSYDTYISPVEYVSGIEEISQVMLSKGIVKNYEGYEVQFVGFNAEKLDMMKGNGILTAEIEFRKSGRKYMRAPGLELRGGKAIKNVETRFPGTNREISLLSLDVGAQEVMLYIEPGRESTPPPSFVIVEVSYKRLIWLVWLGTIFITIGCIFGVRTSLRSLFQKK